MAAVVGLAVQDIAVTYRSGTAAEVSSSLDRVVVDEVVAGLPVREFRWYKGRRHYSGWYWSATMRQMIVYESLLELARIMLAYFDPSVVAVAAQPFRLSGLDGDRVRRHVPDLLLVDRFGGVTVVDVKAPHKREDAQVRAVMAWTRAVVALRGRDFEEWYGAPRQVLSNVTFLAGYRRATVVDLSLVDDVLTVVGAGAAIADVERTLDMQGTARVRPVVLHLLWHGVFTADLTRPLDGLTVVRPNAVEATT